MRINTKNLPQSKENLLPFLIDYFSGKNVAIVKEGSGYVDINLSDPSSDDYYIDPQIMEGIRWWDKETTIKQIPDLFRNYSKYQLSLNDNWTLYSWSLWLEQKISDGNLPEEIVILHIDDHRDCMCPLLFKTDDIVFNPLNNEEVSLFKSDSIKRAIESGAISIGSFMTLFLHSMPRVQLRHLMPEYRIETARSGQIICDVLSDNILANDQKRLQLNFSSNDFNSNIEYLPFTEINSFLDNISDKAAILLHVDMDYFNNRFDGDSDWRSHKFIHDPTADEVYKNVEDTFSAILRHEISPKIEDYTIALSPGFFPVEFWQGSVSIINNLLSKTP